MPQAAFAEKRAHPRQDVLRPGRVVHGRTGRSVPCQIIDLSAGGARLLLQEDGLPDEGLTLIDQQLGSLNDCRVVWRKARLVGVCFVPAVESARRKAQLRHLRLILASGSEVEALGAG
jgi:hypothetical protein